MYVSTGPHHSDGSWPSTLTTLHSVESPSMVDTQWNILYWGSKWNLHTVCWCAVGCEWGTTSVHFGITYVWFIPSWLPVFAVEPQYQHRDFLFLLKVSFEGHIQNLQKDSCRFKIWMGFVGPILIKLGTSSIWGFLYCPACRTYEIATRFWEVVICPIYMCLTVYEFSFILFDLCLFITIFNFILNYVLIVTFWIFTYYKIWITLIIYCFIDFFIL